MNIVDTHTHLPGHTFGLTPRPIADLREEFRNEGLSGAWLMTTDGLLGDCGKHNDILAAAVKDDLDFFVPFGTVSPHDGAESAIKELRRCRFDLGMRGLKLHPWVQAFSLTHPAVLPILQEAGRLDMPVLFHDGTPPYSTPLQIAAAAEQVPGTTVILGHGGLDDLHRDAILACLRHDNVHICLCSVSSGNAREIIGECPAERMLFGSDGGFGGCLVRNAITKIRATGAPAEVQECILSTNAQRLLPLP